MSDLDEIQASGATKLVGSNGLGGETTPVSSTGTGDLNVADVTRGTGLQTTLTVGTSPVEVKVGGSRLADRKIINIDNTSNGIIYWGYSASTSTTSFAGRLFKDQQMFLPAGPSTAVYLVASTAGNSVHIGEA